MKDNNGKLIVVLIIATWLLYGCARETSEFNTATNDVVATYAQKVVMNNVYDPSQSSIDVFLTQELEDYIVNQYRSLNLVLNAQYEYYSNDVPLAEGWLPLEADQDEYWNVCYVLLHSIDEVANKYGQNREDTYEETVITLAFSYSQYDGKSGYVVRLYCDTDDSYGIQIIKNILGTPMYCWTNKDQYILADIINEKNLYNTHWLITNRMKYDWDWMVIFYGYVRSGKYKDTLVSFQLLYNDENIEYPRLVYLGYINEDGTLAAEKFADLDQYEDFSVLWDSIYGFLNMPE